jgi:CRISPR-associated endonuclease/helicase Cas3
MTGQETRAAGSRVDVLWGKSSAGGQPNLLLQHLFDAAAVAELIWDRFLAPGFRARLDECCDGGGRALFRLMCGLHDVGKASPAFQVKAPALAEAVRRAGLDMRPGVDRAEWHHTLAGAVIVRRTLPDAGWEEAAVDWCWPLVAGHHGLVPPPGRLGPRSWALRRAHGDGDPAWRSAQDGLVRAVAAGLGVDLRDAAPALRPSRATQLALCGAIIMADWIASGDRHFPGVPRWEDVSMSAARKRATTAWKALGLRGGWEWSRDDLPADLVQARFGRQARISQRDAVSLAEAMPAPGLLLVEAPMGEGKTETALAAAEVLSRRFGADGVFVGMPTQAASDPMFERVLRWSTAVDDRVPVGLLHGKRAFNRVWQALIDTAPTTYAGIDDYGLDEDLYGLASTAPARSGQAPAEWLRGPKRGLLMPVVVGTIDQLLHAATRTKHVMLRHAGLAGKVVILDEVHAYDVYMAQFLMEALRWLGDAGVPVIALSATLPPDLRTALARAYLDGVAGGGTNSLILDLVQDYPVSTAVSQTGDGTWVAARSSPPARPPLGVAVQILDEDPGSSPAPVVDVLSEALTDGGCALVIRNTVRRAQDTFAALRPAFGDDVTLVHGRLTVGDRADRMEEILRLVGPPDSEDSSPRPARFVVVATQVAEQSFDADFDLLVTDLAPVDLLLQRVGRVHRHARPAGDRPARVAAPRVVVTGLRRRGRAEPAFPSGSRAVYGDYLLLRTAALIEEAAAGSGWSVPTDVPGLVRRCYAIDEEVVPELWRPAAERARRGWDGRQAIRAGNARGFLLSTEGEVEETLAGLHDRATGELADDDAVAAVVRDGPETVEVVLVVQDGSTYRSLAGRPLGSTGEAVSDSEVADEVARSAVRLPERVTAAAKELRPLPGWGVQPWLARARALVLGPDASASLGGRRLGYDAELGLLDEPAR